MLNTKERLEYNLKIIDKLKELIQENPDLRFIQLLHAIGIIEADGSIRHMETKVIPIKDKFSEEPDQTLEKLEDYLVKLKGV